jgi:hypothetical protein
MQEYYIRKEGDEDSRGPFTLEQLTSLVEVGQVDRQTYYYDAIGEKWIEIQSNRELVDTLFPAKKKLVVRAKESVQTINVPPTEEETPITVEEMLAAADGRTAETASKRDLTGDRARNALWGMRLMATMLLVSAAGLLISNMNVLSTLEFFAIVSSALIVIGVVDLILALLLFLEVTSIYSLVRIRALLGAGFFLFYFLTQGEVIPAAAVSVGSACLYAGTLVSQLTGVVLIGLFGLAGMGGFAYILLH